jgi:hypothetical protein
MERPPALCDEIAFDMPEIAEHCDSPADELAAKLLTAAGFPLESFAILNGNVGCHDPGTLTSCQFRPRVLVAHSLLSLTFKPIFRQRTVSVRAYPATRGCVGCGRHHSDRNARCADCRAHTKATGRIKYFCRHCITSSYEANHERDCAEKGSRRPCKCGKPGHLQARCPTTAARHVLLHKVDLPRDLRNAATRIAEQEKAAEAARPAAAAAQAAAPPPPPADAQPASIAAPPRPQRPTEPAPMRVATQPKQPPITRFLGTAPVAPWAPAPPGAATAQATVSPQPVTAVGTTSAAPPAAQTAPLPQQDALERVLAAMAVMQQQIDAQLKLFSARLAALEMGAATAAARSEPEQATKKHKAGAAAPLSRPPNGAEEAGEDDAAAANPRDNEPSAGAAMAAAATVSPTKQGKNKRSLHEGDDAIFLQSAEQSAGDL